MLLVRMMVMVMVVIRRIDHNIGDDESCAVEQVTLHLIPTDLT